MKPTALDNTTEVGLGVRVWPTSRLGQFELSLQVCIELSPPALYSYGALRDRQRMAELETEIASEWEMPTIFRHGLKERANCLRMAFSKLESCQWGLYIEGKPTS
jgi:hypothetical protein